jgi:hypothetical protein
VKKNQQSTKQRVGLVCKRYAQYCGTGHYYLTLLLLDNIKATAKDSCIEGHIVFTASEGCCYFTYKEGINFLSLKDPAI